MIDPQILEYINESDEPPTYREIQKALGYSSVSVIFDAVQRLRRDGKLLPTDGTRGIKPIGYVSRKELKEQLKECKEEIHSIGDFLIKNLTEEYLTKIPGKWIENLES